MITVMIFAAGICQAITGNQLDCDGQTIYLNRVKASASREHLAEIIEDSRVLCHIDGKEGECSADFYPSLNNVMIEYGSN